MAAVWGTFSLIRGMGTRRGHRRTASGVGGGRSGEGDGAVVIDTTDASLGGAAGEAKIISVNRIQRSSWQRMYASRNEAMGTSLESARVEVSRWTWISMCQEK